MSKGRPSVIAPSFGVTGSASSAIPRSRSTVPRSVTRLTVTELDFIIAAMSASQSFGTSRLRISAGGDDGVGARQQLAEPVELLPAKFGRRGSGIAALRATVLLPPGEVEEDELSSHRRDLLGHRGPDVEGVGEGAKADAGADRGEACHARVDRQNLSRRKLAGGRRLASED